MTELILRPKNSISCTGVNTDFFKFMTNSRCCRKKITGSRLVTISSKEWPTNSMSSKQIIILMFILRKNVIGTFSKFVNILEACTKPKQRQRYSYKFSDQRNRTNCYEFFSKGTEKYPSFKSSLHM